MQAFDPIAILGTGLLGGSIGLGLRAAGCAGRIVGFGRTQQTLAKARELGCIDEGFTDLAAAVRGCKLVVLATPVRAIPPLMEQLADVLPPDAVVTDVGSTKREICAAARQHLQHPERFVGAHPMAGSELHGPAHARADLFRGRLCILTPAGTNAQAEAVARVESLWQALGMTLTVKSPEEHDEMVAVISHLPHAVAVMLVELADRQKAMSVAATGFRDTTRIASGDPQVWLDIFTTNRDAILAAIDRFSEELGRFRSAVERCDEPAIRTLLEHAKAARDAWVENHEPRKMR